MKRRFILYRRKLGGTFYVEDNVRWSPLNVRSRVIERVVVEAAQALAP